jgi:hypothetical protein
MGIGLGISCFFLMVIGCLLVFDFSAKVPNHFRQRQRQVQSHCSQVDGSQARRCCENHRIRVFFAAILDYQMVLKKRLTWPPFKQISQTYHNCWSNMVFSKILDTHLLVRWFCQLYRYTVFIGHISTMFDYGRVVIMTSHRFSWFIGHCSHMDGVVACIRLLLFCVFDVWICKIAIHRSYFLWTNFLYNPAINLPFGDGKHTTQQNGDFGHCLWHWVGPRTSPHVHPLNPIWLTILSGIFYHLRYGVLPPLLNPP